MNHASVVYTFLRAFEECLRLSALLYGRVYGYVLLPNADL